MKDLISSSTKHNQVKKQGWPWNQFKKDFHVVDRVDHLHGVLSQTVVVQQALNAPFQIHLKMDALTLSPNGLKIPDF